MKVLEGKELLKVFLFYKRDLYGSGWRSTFFNVRFLRTRSAALCSSQIQCFLQEKSVHGFPSFNASVDAVRWFIRSFGSEFLESNLGPHTLEQETASKALRLTSALIPWLPGLSQTQICLIQDPEQTCKCLPPSQLYRAWDAERTPGTLVHCQWHCNCKVAFLGYISSLATCTPASYQMGPV